MQPDQHKIRQRCILRFAFGITACIALSFAIAWPLSAFAPILAASFLSNAGPRPDLKATLAILLAITIIFGVGLVVTIFLYPYPFVFLPLFCAALYLNYLAAARGTAAFVVILYTLAILLLPLLGANSSALAIVVCQGFLTSAMVALFVVQLAHTLFPGNITAQPGGAAPPAANSLEAAGSAWLSTAVVLPAALLCLVFNLTNMILPLILIALLSQKPDFSVGAAGGKALLAANLGGGLVAVIFYQLLLINPSYVFLIAGFFAMALLFGERLFSDRPTAGLYATAFNTVIILIGSGTGAFGGEADSLFIQRIIQILLAVCYVVGALSLLQSLRLRQHWLQLGRRLRKRLRRVSQWLPG